MPAAGPRIGVVRCGRLANQYHLSTLLVFLAGAGFRVELLAIQCPDDDLAQFRDEHPQIEVIDVGEYNGRGISRFLRGGLALRDKLLQAEVGLLYVVDSWTLRYFAIAALASDKVRRTALVYHTFDMLSPGVAAWYERLLERFFARRVPLVVVTDRARGAIMKALYQLSREPLPLAVRMLRDAALPSRDECLRNALLPAGCTFLVVAPTRVSEERVARDVIRAASQLPPTFAVVTFAGDADYTRECEELAGSLGLGPRFCVLPETSHGEVLRICAASDAALVFQDDSSSLGNFFAHPSRVGYCAALGLPVVANAVPSIQSMVYEHGLGECATASDHASVAAAVQRVCGSASSSERRAQIRKTFVELLCFELEGGTLLTRLKEVLRAAQHGEMSADAD